MDMSFVRQLVENNSLFEVKENPANTIAGLEDFNRQPQLQHAQSVAVDNLSVNWSDPGAPRSATRCPVFVDVREDGSKIFTTYISGAIADFTNYVDLVDTLLTAGPNDIYYVMLDSPGGEISCGSVIASAIWKSQAKVITIARGLCASAAALIHAAVKPGNSYVSDMGILMIHMSSHVDKGVSTKILTNAQQQVRYVNENLLKPAVEMGYVTADELNAIQNGAQIFITAQQFRERVLSRYQQGA